MHAQADIARAFAAAKAAQPGWDGLGGAGRAKILRAMAEALEQHRDALMAIAVHEAGKTWPDAVAEVREAADFCRYYALLAEQHFARPEPLKGPAGETNALELHGRGVFACISPWNFPLAIFTGQIAAALAAGNTVLAKPAEQTPRIAAAAVRLFKQAGLPNDVLHLLPGPGETCGRGADHASRSFRRRLHRRHRHGPGDQPQSGGAQGAARCPSSPRPAGSTPCSWTPPPSASR